MKPLYTYRLAQADPHVNLRFDIRLSFNWARVPWRKILSGITSSRTIFISDIVCPPLCGPA